MSKNYDMNHSNIKLAAVFCVLGAFAASFMVLFVKLAAPSTNNSMTIFFRFLVSFAYILVIVVYKVARGNPLSLKAHRIWLHLIRALFGASSMLFLYYSLKFIPLMDGTLLSMTNPLFIPLIALALLKIKTKFKVIIAIVVGFCGVLVVIRPGYNGVVNPHAIYALGSGVSAAFAIVLLRELAKKDSPQVIMFYYFLFAVIIGGIIACGNWKMPDTHTLFLLLGVGVFGTLYQECLIRASAFAPAPVISVYLYLVVVFSGILDWLVWGLRPDVFTCVGLIMICVSSYFVAKSK